MAIRGIGRKPPATSRIPWLPLSLSMPAEARRALRAMGHTWDVDARIIGSLIRGLQDAGTWGKYRAVYPFYPGRAASNNNHRWNLKDPQDTNGAFRITWSGTVSHTANGISSATAGYGNTNLIPSTAGMAANSVSIAAYTSIDPVSNAIAIGTNSAGAEWALSMAGAPAVFYPSITSNATYPNVEVLSGGLFVATRTDATTIRGYQNGSEIVNAAQGSTILPALPFFVLGSNNAVGIDSETSQIVRYAAIGSGLTNAEVAADFSVVEAYQRALGRGITVDPVVANWEARVLLAGGSVSAGNRALMDELITALKADGTLSTIQRWYFPSGSDSFAGAMVPVIDTLSLGNFTNVGFAAGNWTAAGLAGTGSEYVRSGFIPATHIADPNSFNLSIGVANYVASGSFPFIVGAEEGEKSLTFTSTDTPEAFLEMYEGTTSTYTGATLGSGTIAGNRSSASNHQLFFNGSALSANTTTRTVAPPGVEAYFHCRNLDGSPSNPSTSRLLSISLGSSQTSGQMATFAAALADYRMKKGI